MAVVNVTQFITTASWLNIVVVCEVIKITVTLCKYFPQMLLNYQRKSTIGWAIENVILDFSGSVLNFLQMELDSVNSG